MPAIDTLRGARIISFNYTAAWVLRGILGLPPGATILGVDALQAPQTAADTYTCMVTHLLPVGLKVLVAAAMLAAAMQTCSAALNSTATLVACDLFRRHKPDLTDHAQVTIGRITTVAGTLLAIVASPPGNYRLASLAVG